jgi:hypothetical protein
MIECKFGLSSGIVVVTVLQHRSVDIKNNRAIWLLQEGEEGLVIMKNE